MVKENEDLLLFDKRDFFEDLGGVFRSRWIFYDLVELLKIEVTLF